MKNSPKNKKIRQKQILNSAATLSALALFPIIGLLVLPRKTLSWKRSTKWIVAISTVLYIPFHAVIFASLFLFGGVNYIGRDTQALQYLQNRYHEEFIIIRNASSDQLGGSINYNKWAAPKNDTSLEFRVSKCLARCQSYEPTEFHDYYPQKRWTKQLTEQFKKELALNDRQGIAVYANSSIAAQIVDTHHGSIPEFYSMTETERQQVAVSVHFSENDGAYNPDTKETHANRILQISSLIRASKAGAGSITYDIRATTPAGVSTNSKDQFHFTTDNALDLKKPSEVYPLFVVHTYGRGAILDGYKQQQIQLNASRGQSSVGSTRPGTKAIKKAERELALADAIRDIIALDYLVAPYVVVTVDDDLTDAPIDYDGTATEELLTSVSVFNYPNETIPISIEAHEDYAVVLVNTLKNMFNKSNLTYKSDSFNCDLKAIDTSTHADALVHSCRTN